MFDIAPTELLIVGVVALLVIGPKDLPKDLPKAMRFVGNWMGKARRMASHFRAGVDNMMREAELEDLKKEWEEQNQRIMQQFPNADDMSPVMREHNPGFPAGDTPAEDIAKAANSTQSPVTAPLGEPVSTASTSSTSTPAPSSPSAPAGGNKGSAA